MTAPERIWAHLPETYGSVKIGTCADTVRYQPHGTEYIIHTSAALASSPLVQEIVAEAVKAEREACAFLADMSADWHADGAVNAMNPTQKHGNELMNEASAAIAAAIRARGEGLPQEKGE